MAMAGQIWTVGWAMVSAASKSQCQGLRHDTLLTRNRFSINRRGGGGGAWPGPDPGRQGGGGALQTPKWLYGSMGFVSLEAPKDLF